MSTHSTVRPTLETSRSVSSGVQSLDRTFLILEVLADAGGVAGLTQLREGTGLPLATIHRLLRSLADLGYIRQEATREYSLGPGLIRLGETASRRLGRWARPHLCRVVSCRGEAVRLAILECDALVCLSQVTPRRSSVPIVSAVGQRSDPHATAAGKAILARLSPTDVVHLLERTGMRALTQHTITSPDAFLRELEHTRENGYAVDDQEQEVGVRSVSVAVPDQKRHLAVSLSGPLDRMSDAAVREDAVALEVAASAIAAELVSWHQSC